MLDIKEIEIKYKIEQEKEAKLKELLRKRKFELKEKGEETDIYYSRPDVDFMKTRECLRIRHKPAYTELTYKPPTTEEMLKEKKFWKKEVNVRIDNQLKEIQELLRNLGFRELGTVNKKREVYKIYDVFVSIDSIENLGKFVELEVQTDDEIYGLEALEACANLLNLKRKDIVTKPYRDLIIEQQN